MAAIKAQGGAGLSMSPARCKVPRFGPKWAQGRATQPTSLEKASLEGEFNLLFGWIVKGVLDEPRSMADGGDFDNVRSDVVHKR